MNIYQRINAVMQAVAYVKKDVSVSGGGTYSAVSHDMVLAVLRKAMVENGIVTRTEQLRGKIVQLRDVTAGIKQHMYCATYNIHFVNMEDPKDFMTVTIQGHANDSGDKAPGKAVSYAVKYALLKTFGLETGESDEGRMAEDDLTEIASQIMSASDLNELQSTFKMAWHSYPRSRKELTAMKDEKKKELAE